MPVKLPNKATWTEFKKSHNDFTPGECENCHQPSDRLVWIELVRVCYSCRDWIKQNRSNGR